LPAIAAKVGIISAKYAGTALVFGKFLIAGAQNKNNIWPLCGWLRKYDSGVIEQIKGEDEYHALHF